MSHQEQAPRTGSSAAAVIDSLEFARIGGRIDGDVPVVALPRLIDLVEDDGGALSFSLVGGRNPDGKSYLQLTVEGRLRLRCQRCLRPMDWPVFSCSRLVLVAPGESWPDEAAADEADPIEADKAQAVSALIEDEVLLALPISPRHERCDLPAGAGRHGDQSPFAVLANLKKT